MTAWTSALILFASLCFSGNAFAIDFAQSCNSSQMDAGCYNRSNGAYNIGCTCPFPRAARSAVKAKKYKVRCDDSQMEAGCYNVGNGAYYTGCVCPF